MATHIQSNGQSKQVSPANGKVFSLEELQGFVGGWIEAVHLRDGRMMFVNEEGRLRGLPVNPEASDLYGADTIVGDALVVDATEVE